MTAPEQAGFRAVVRGRVQGVGFRYSALREARRLGVTGMVRNAEDGSVEVHAEGDRRALEMFHAWLEEGPPGAHVRDVEITWMPFSGGYQGFDIEF